MIELAYSIVASGLGLLIALSGVAGLILATRDKSREEVEADEKRRLLKLIETREGKGGAA